MPMTPFIGVRISWLMLARNSPLARVAAIAASRAARSASSASSGSVMSRAIPVNIRRSPSRIRSPPGASGTSSRPCDGPSTSRPMPMIFLRPVLPVVGEVAVVFAVIGLGHEHLDVLPDDLLRRITEEAFGGRVERLDRPRSSMVRIASAAASRMARVRASLSFSRWIASFRSVMSLLISRTAAVGRPVAIEHPAARDHDLAPSRLSWISSPSHAPNARQFPLDLRQRPGESRLQEFVRRRVPRPPPWSIRRAAPPPGSRRKSRPPWSGPGWRRWA